MTKKFIIILLTLLVLTACSSEKKRKPLTFRSNEFITQDIKEELKAAELGVKSRTLITYFYDNKGKMDDRGYTVEEIFYDENGNKAVQIRYGAGGLIDLQYEYHYDDDGNMRYSKTTDMYGKEFYYRESEYNYVGLEIQREERQKKGVDELETIFTYNDSGLVTEELQREKKGSVVSRTVYHYEDNKISHLENFNVNGLLIDEKFFTYDSVGYLDTELLTQGEHFSQKTDYMFAPDGKVLEIDEGYFKRTFEYNENGNVEIEKAYNKNGYLQQKLVFSYNSLGLIESRIKTDGEEVPVIFTEYKYEFY